MDVERLVLWTELPEFEQLETFDARQGHAGFPWSELDYASVLRKVGQASSSK